MLKRKIYDEYKKLGIPQNEVNAEFNMILDYLNIDSLRVIKDGFTAEEIKKIEEIVTKRIQSTKPLQHILGFGYFMGEKFFVNENTLIPRPETEILVSECSKLVDEKSHVLDIGTGSGCISISLAKLTCAKVDAVDISSNALEIAKKNAKFHKVNVNFFQSDLFSNVKNKYDLIVSNPPYIPISKRNELDDVVKNFEPHAALFANDEFGIDFYEKIISKAATFLNKTGYVGLELGINQAERVAEIFSQYGFKSPTIINDFDNIKRVIISKKN